MIAKAPDIPVKSHPLGHVDEYLEIGQKAGASDVHLAVNAQPIWRLHGTLQPIWPDAPRLTGEQTAALAESFVPDVYKRNSIRAGIPILRMQTSSPATAPVWSGSGSGSKLFSA